MGSGPQPLPFFFGSTPPPRVRVKKSAYKCWHVCTFNPLCLSKLLVSKLLLTPISQATSKKACSSSSFTSLKHFCKRYMSVTLYFVIGHVPALFSALSRMTEREPRVTQVIKFLSYSQHINVDMWAPFPLSADTPLLRTQFRSSSLPKPAKVLV